MVAALEQQIFTAGAWDEEQFRYEWEGNPYATLWVAETEQQVIGYIGVWIIFDRAEITTLAVHPAYRRQGLGRRLLEQAIQDATAAECELMTLEVRQSNQAAIALYEKVGFTIVSVRKDYYQDNHEDAWLMMKGLI